MTPDLCFANAKIVLDDRILRGAVHISDGKIAEIVEGDHVPFAAIDCAGDFLLPGLVELHTDNLERHLEPRPKVYMPADGAIVAHDAELASAGIATVFDALRVCSILKREQRDRNYARAAANKILNMRAKGALRVRHLLHLRAEICSDTLISDFAAFDIKDSVGLVSMMDHTPGQRQFRDLDKLQDYYTGKYGYSDAEFKAVLAARRVLGEKVRDKHERVTVAEAARLGAILASHDDTTVQHVQHSTRFGIQLAEFPTTLEAAQACHDHGIAIIMGAPNLIREASHSGNVSALELAQAGLLDVVSSDYAPSLLLASAFKLANIWDDLPRAIKTVSATPAKMTNLSDRGRIAVGCLGDVLRVRMLDYIPIIRGLWCAGQQVG